jgi:hypothetical protein
MAARLAQDDRKTSVDNSDNFQRSIFNIGDTKGEQDVPTVARYYIAEMAH